MMTEAKTETGAVVGETEAAIAAWRDGDKPIVGLGLSVYGWSDIEPGTIVRVNEKGTRIWYTLDECRLLNGVNSGAADALHFSPGGFVGHTSGTQRWEMTPNPAGRVESATLRKDGKWRRVGESRNGKRIRLGRKVKHYDYNF